MKIILGITGSVAAIKSYEFVMKLTENKHEVKTILTYNGAKFVSSFMLNSLDANIVDSNYSHFAHLELADWADLVCIYPITGNFISKIATGISDDLLSLVSLISKNKLMIMPAMNSSMWLDQIIQDNIQKLKSMNVHVVGPIIGKLACGDKNMGHIADIDDILTALQVFEHKKSNILLLKNKKILILSGKTIEFIDSIRFISNNSSGKMGHALAKVCREMGADVTMIKSQDCYNPYNIHTIIIQTTEEMLNATLKMYENYDIIINVAAISDISIKMTANTKLSKEQLLLHPLEIKLNNDILKTISKNKQNRIIIGFCANEDSKLLESAQNKLHDKNLDAIIANPISSFNKDNTSGFILYPNGKNITIPHSHKLNAAIQIVQSIIDNLI